eukprot:5173909-Alexandrium_andersonii.AAC.1
MEIYGMTVDIERAWQENRRRKKSTVDDEEPPNKQARRSQAGYESEYWAFVSSAYPQRFSSFNEFDRCKNFRNKMMSAGLWTEFATYMSKCCIYTDMSMNNSTIIYLNFGTFMLFD